MGSTTHSVAAVAIEASMALPPRRSVSTPAALAMGTLDATSPRRASTQERSLFNGWLARPRREGSTGRS
jgi:hypothetical protein